jgi:hypothetical protein
VTGILRVDRTGRFGLGTTTGVVTDNTTGRATVVSQVVGQTPSLSQFDGQLVTVCGTFTVVRGQPVLQVRAIFPAPAPPPPPPPPVTQCVAGILIVDATPRFGVGTNTGVVINPFTGQQTVISQVVGATPSITNFNGRFVIVCGTFSVAQGQRVLSVQQFFPINLGNVNQSLLGLLLLLLTGQGSIGGTSGTGLGI